VSVLRLLFATAFVVLALLLIVGQVMLLRESEPTHPLQYTALSALAGCLLVSAFYYSRPLSHWQSQLRCPHCHESGSLAFSALRRPRVSPGAHLLGGLLGSLLYSHARKRGFVCGTCQAPSDLRTFGGWLALAWLLMFVFMIVVELYLSEGT